MTKTKTIPAAEAMSTNDQIDAVRGAFSRAFDDANKGEFIYCEDVFLNDGYLICELGGAYYRVDYTRTDGAFVFAPRAEWKKMEQTYTPAGESKRRTAYFAERVDLREAEVDSENYIVKGVTLIKPGFSTNTDKAGRPRYYPKEALAEAAQVFEGVRMFFNHPRRSDEKELPERDVRDIGGYYRNVRAADDGRLLADLHLVKSKSVIDDTFPLIQEAIANKPDLVELSINALGATRLGEAEGRKAVVVEAIVGANSVDLVTTGAAGGSFAGALLASDGDGWTRDLMRAIAFEEWRAARPEFVERLKAEWKTVRETDELKTLRARLKETETEVTRLEEAKRAEAVELDTFRRAAQADRLLASSRLPKQLREAVREEMLAATDDAGMQAVLEREEKKYKLAPRAPVSVTGAGQRVSHGQPATEARPAPSPAARLLQIDESRMPLPGESAEAYRARRMREAQTNP